MGTANEDEVLAGIKRLILEEKRDFLCKYMNPERYMDYMRSKFVINEEDKEEIEYEKTRRKRASVMIDILLKKGVDAYDVFVMAIQRDRTQTHLVQMLHMEYEKRKNNYFALVKGNSSSDIKINTASLPKPPPPPPSTESESSQTKTADHVPSPAVQTLLCTRGPVCNGSNTQQKAETIYYRNTPTFTPALRTPNRIPSVVLEAAIGETTPPTERNTIEHNHLGSETESMKERKELTNRNKLKFTSRSADHGESDPSEETNKKEENFREGEENTESESLQSSDLTAVKEIF
ncbi:uncharacterized protein [Argopecten irradians]|uniref:uncharacterized protein n=1 Tax=Argopecten irradians TaxID=31199 RepID=UPI0037160142